MWTDRNASIRASRHRNTSGFSSPAWSESMPFQEKTKRNNNTEMKGHNNIKGKGVKGADVPPGQAGKVRQLWGEGVLFH
jgi:hypothetical protein